MEVCSKCGHYLEPGAQQCSYCGAQILRQPPANYNSYPYAQQTPYPPSYYPPQPVAQPSNGMSIASLVLGICTWVLCPLFLAVLGLIFGIIGLNQQPRNGMAIAGIILSALNLVLFIGLFVIALVTNSVFYYSY